VGKCYKVVGSVCRNGVFDWVNFPLGTFCQPGQVAELVVVGCSTTSSADCHSVAADVLLVSSIPVLRFGEPRRLVVFVVGRYVLDVL
jgi:hypothetical protein